MRLFIAVDLNHETYFRDIQKMVDRGNADMNLTKSYHLTLKFLGDVDEALLEKIKFSLDKVDFESFAIKTSKIEVFPNLNFIKVVWVGLEPEDKIIELQKRIDTSLKDVFSLEKSFKPHITLARVKFLNDKNRFVDNLKNIRIEQKSFKVDCFKLVKSNLTPVGPVYEDIFTKPLTF